MPSFGSVTSDQVGVGAVGAFACSVVLVTLLLLGTVVVETCGDPVVDVECGDAFGLGAAVPGAEHEVATKASPIASTNPHSIRGRSTQRFFTFRVEIKGCVLLSGWRRLIPGNYL
jgi:hypothetical protein